MQDFGNGAARPPHDLNRAAFVAWLLGIRCMCLAHFIFQQWQQMRCGDAVTTLWMLKLLVGSFGVCMFCKHVLSRMYIAADVSRNFFSSGADWLSEIEGRFSNK